MTTATKKSTTIQVDRSGVGHNWVAADDDSMPPSIREEIMAEIIDGRVAHTDCYIASNGLRYRW